MSGSSLVPSTHQIDDVLHGNQFAALEDIQKTLSSPRHFLRRQAVVGPQMQNDVSSLKNKATVSEKVT